MSHSRCQNLRDAGKCHTAERRACRRARLFDLPDISDRDLLTCDTLAILEELIRDREYNPDQQEAASGVRVILNHGRITDNAVDANVNVD